LLHRRALPVNGLSGMAPAAHGQPLHRASSLQSSQAGAPSLAPYQQTGAKAHQPLNNYSGNGVGGASLAQHPVSGAAMYLGPSRAESPGLAVPYSLQHSVSLPGLSSRGGYSGANGWGPDQMAKLLQVNPTYSGPGNAAGQGTRPSEQLIWQDKGAQRSAAVAAERQRAIWRQV
jgi:hypothetical protein